MSEKWLTSNSPIRASRRRVCSGRLLSSHASTASATDRPSTAWWIRPREPSPPNSQAAQPPPPSALLPPPSPRLAPRTSTGSLQTRGTYPKCERGGRARTPASHLYTQQRRVSALYRATLQCRAGCPGTARSARLGSRAASPAGARRGRDVSTGLATPTPFLSAPLLQWRQQRRRRLGLARRLAEPFRVVLEGCAAEQQVAPLPRRHDVLPADKRRLQPGSVLEVQVLAAARPERQARQLGEVGGAGAEADHHSVVRRLGPGSESSRWPACRKSATTPLHGSSPRSLAAAATAAREGRALHRHSSPLPRSRAMRPHRAHSARR